MTGDMSELYALPPYKLRASAELCTQDVNAIESWLAAKAAEQKEARAALRDQRRNEYVNPCVH